jgi:hypothetical protein
MWETTGNWPLHCNDLNLYSGGTWFESRKGHQKLWLRYFVAFLSPIRKMLEEYFHQAMTTSFQILSNSSFIYHHTIWYYIVCDIKNVRK